MKKFLTEKGMTAADAVTGARVKINGASDTEETVKKESIELSIIYYMDDGAAAECIMDWDMHGYGFRRPSIAQ